MIDTVELSGTVAVVLAGGQGTRLHELTDRDSKPALPFARYHRIIDFAMAGLVRSGIGRVIVATQHRPANLKAHVKAAWMPSFSDNHLTLRDGEEVAPAAGIGAPPMFCAPMRPISTPWARVRC